MSSSIQILQDGWYDDRPRSFLIYAPSRTAVIFALTEDKPEPELEPGLEAKLKPELETEAEPEPVAG